MHVDGVDTEAVRRKSNVTDEEEAGFSRVACCRPGGITILQDFFFSLSVFLAAV